MNEKVSRQANCSFLDEEFFRQVVLKGWPLDQQRLHHLGTCSGADSPAPSQAYEIRNSVGGTQETLTRPPDDSAARLTPRHASLD